MSILIFISTCKQLIQSEHTEFSKNGVFHSKTVVITFSKCLNLNPNPTLQHAIFTNFRIEIMESTTLRHYKPLLQKIYRNRIPEKFLITEILDI